MSLKNWSLRSKIIALGIGLPALVFSAVLYTYYVQEEEQVVLGYVDKARSVCLSTESTRQGMEDY